MAARVSSVKVFNVLKQCCNPFSVCHSANSIQNLRHVLEEMMKNVYSIQKGKSICDKCTKTISNLPEFYKNAACFYRYRHK